MKLQNIMALLFLPMDAGLHDSTAAFSSKQNSIVFKDGNWIDESSGCRFDAANGEFKGDDN